MEVQTLIPMVPPVAAEPEIVGPDEAILVWVSALPFAPMQSRRPIWVPVGTSLEEIVQQAQPNPVRRRHTQVWVNSETAESYIDPKFWARIRPRLGSVVYVMALPGDREQFLQLAILAAAIAAPFAIGAPFTATVAGSTSLTLAGSILTGSVSALGLLGATALIKPPSQSGGSVDQLNQISTFQTFRNVLDPWGLFERPVGTCRIFPTFLAEPYSDIRDQQEWKRYVFAGRGPCEFEDFRFGNTAADKLRRIKIRHTQGWPESPVTFVAGDVDVNDNKIRMTAHPYIRHNPMRFRAGTPPPPLQTQTTYWIVSRTRDAIKLATERGGDPIILTGTGTGATIFRREPRPGIYPGVVFEDPTNIVLNKGVSHVLTTQPDTDDAKILFFFPTGLGKFDDKNPEDLDPQTVQVRVRFRLKGTGQWSASDETSYPAQNTPRIPRPDPDRQRIDETWTDVRTLAVYGVSMNPDSGKLRITAPTTTPAPLNRRGFSNTQPTLPPFPPHLVPLAYVTRASDDNRKINKSEIQDVRPPVSGFDFPKGVRFGDSEDFRPRPTSPRKQKIRIRRGKIKKIALVVTAKKREQFFRTVELDFPTAGEYEVEITRINDAGGDKVFDEVRLTAIQSFTNKNIIDEEARREGIWLIEVLALAQDNLEGIADKFNCLATSIFQRWDGTEWQYRPTNNIGDCVRGILQGPGNINPVPDSRLVLADFEEFVEWCADKRYTCGQIVDFLTTVRRAANDVASVGRGALARVDLNIGITIDRNKSNRVTVFARHNMVKGSLSVDLPFSRVPHSFRVRFRNERKDYNFDEIEVFGDGFDDATRNRTKTEVLNVPMITRPGHAKEFARYMWLVAKHRQKRYGWVSPLHGFAQRHGDLNGLNHDVAFLGSGSARVVAISTSVGNVDTVTLSTPVIMAAATSYRIQFIKPDAGPPVKNRILIEDVDTVVGEQSVLTLTTPPPIADGPEVDEMLVFGELDKGAADVVIAALNPVSPYRARFQAYDLAPAVFQVDGEAFDETSSVLTIPADIDRPVVLGIESDDTVTRIVHDGSIEIAIVVSLKPPQALSFFATRLEAQIREKPLPFGEFDDEAELASWTPLPFLPIGSASVRFTSVRKRRTYEMRFRYASDQAPGAAWVTIENTVVGITLPPPDVTVVTASLDELQWQYDRPLRVIGFRIRVHFGSLADWNTALPLHPQDQPVPNSPFTLSDIRGTSKRTLLVKAVDIDGNESQNPGTVLFDFGLPVFENIVLQTDLHPTFPGTITNGTITGGKLEAVPTGSHWLGSNDDAAYWRADETYPVWDVQYPTFTYEVPFEPRKRGTLSVVTAIDAPGGYNVEIRRDLVAPVWFANEQRTVWRGSDNAAPFWVATAGEFIGVPGVHTVEIEPHTIRLTARENARKTTLEEMSLVNDVEDRKERLQGVAILAAGTTRLPVTQPWEVIEEVVCFITPFQSEVAVSYKVVDQDPTGPLVQTFNAAGALTDGHVTAILGGYFE